MHIIKTPNNILLTKARPVKVVDGKIRRLIKGMKKVLRDSDIGVGLAAPQVGVPLRLFIASPNMSDSEDPEKEPISVYINPVIIKKSKSKNQPVKSGRQEPRTKEKGEKGRSETLEGCLSIPDVWGHVDRSTSIEVEYQDKMGGKHTKTLTGLMATIFQHEVDHLNGILFTHHALRQRKPLFRANPKTGKLDKMEV